MRGGHVSRFLCIEKSGETEREIFLIACTLHLQATVADPGGGDRGSVPPSRSKIIGIIIGSHTCNATFDSTCGLALRLHAYSLREGTSIARSTRFSARLGNKIDRF